MVSGGTAEVKQEIMEEEAAPVPPVLKHTSPTHTWHSIAPSDIFKYHNVL